MVLLNTLKYILDTCTIFNLFRQGEKSENIRKNFLKNNLNQAGSKIYISVITVQEIIYGIEKVALKKGKEYKRKDFDKILLFLNKETVKIPYTTEMAEKVGRIKAKMESKGLNYGDDTDLMIAATATELGFTVITENIKHFKNIPDLQYEDWTVI